MSRAADEDLKPISYVVLALVGEGGAGAHDIAAMMGRSRVYWASAPSQWYAEPKRLAELGYLEAKKAPGKTRERTVYRITAAGRKALRRWLTGPAAVTRMQNEAAVRLLAGDMIGPDALVASLRGMLPELDELEADVDDAMRRAQTVPHRTRYLLLSHALAKKLLGAHREWIAEVETALGERPGPRTRTRAP